MLKAIGMILLRVLFRFLGEVEKREGSPSGRLGDAYMLQRSRPDHGRITDTPPTFLEHTAGTGPGR